MMDEEGRHGPTLLAGPSASYVGDIGSTREPNIFPPTPLPFAYDIATRNREWVRRYADRVVAEIRSSIVEQAEAIEARARAGGWRPIPPKHLGRAAMQRMARRLYLRAVRGLSWLEIEMDEAPAGAVVRRTGSPKKSVELWADALDIPLPVS
jgi:hypothetical protein